ncbi:DUF4180 domain-containing protein [Streptomyces sp. NPDC012637]|uniref:DUF4180 domain-containing protein n=1 Tax=Streptomyces sp. NPDC012637 TaxID=3364842 RepID=UPI0036E04DF8
MSALQDFHGTPVFLCPAEGPLLLGEREALDVIGEGSYAGAAWVAVPVERFSDDFFRLRTRVAGDIVQKFANYRLGLAVVGDISRHLEHGSALRDFVRESNRGTQLWFVPDTAALAERLTPGRRGPAR